MALADRAHPARATWPANGMKATISKPERTFTHDTFGNGARSSPNSWSAWLLTDS